MKPGLPTAKAMKNTAMKANISGQSLLRLDNRCLKKKHIALKNAKEYKRVS